MKRVSKMQKEASNFPAFKVTQTWLMPYPVCILSAVERLNIDDAIEQSERDAKEGEIPAVFHRKNRKKWLVTMRLDDWMKLYKAFEGYMAAGKIICDTLCRTEKSRGTE